MNKLSKTIALVCAISIVPAIVSTQASAAGVTSHLNALPNIAVADQGAIKVTHKFGHVLGGLVAGAIIGGAIANSQRRRRYDPEPEYVEPRGYSGGHVDWCYNRYRSYREYDNTYQPYDGRRRSCRSPYN